MADKFILVTKDEFLEPLTNLARALGYE